MGGQPSIRAGTRAVVAVAAIVLMAAPALAESLLPAPLDKPFGGDAVCTGTLTSCTGTAGNTASSDGGGVFAGTSNMVPSGSDWSVIGGGQLNMAARYSSGVLAGTRNGVDGSMSAIAAGNRNLVLSDLSLILSGTRNRIDSSSPNSLILLGASNDIEAVSMEGVVLGGAGNLVRTASTNSLITGQQNQVNGVNSIVLGAQAVVAEDGGVHLQKGLCGEVSTQAIMVESYPLPVPGCPPSTASDLSFMLNAIGGTVATRSFYGGGFASTSTSDSMLWNAGTSTASGKSLLVFGGNSASVSNSFLGVGGTQAAANSAIFMGGVQAASDSFLGLGGNTATQGSGVAIGDGSTASTFSYVGQGGWHQAVGQGSVVGGGTGHQAVGLLSSVQGGNNGNHAMGAASSIGGGTRQQATGTISTILGGSAGVAQAVALVGGGDRNVASGDFSTILGGQLNAASGVASSIGGGIANRASGDFASVVAGSGNIASGPFATAMGIEAKADLHGQVAQASGASAGGAAGQAQRSEYVLRGRSTAPAPAELFLDGLAQRLTLEPGSTWAFQGAITAALPTGGAAHDWTFKGAIHRTAAGVTTFVGAPAIESVSSDPFAAGWSVGLMADDALDSLRIRGAGSAGVYWVASVDTAELY